MKACGKFTIIPPAKKSITHNRITNISFIPLILSLTPILNCIRDVLNQGRVRQTLHIMLFTIALIISILSVVGNFPITLIDI